tara:strand:- start:554 stop:1006 length:453 start_codon:yes stop_codon:yes gene_type:complete
MLEPLSKKKSKKILNSLSEYFELKKFPLDVIFFQRKDKKIFISSLDLKKLDPFPKYPNSIGVYFAIEESGGVRLSLEGSQILGPYSTKNVIEVSKKELKEWFNGSDLEFESEEKGYVILKFEEDFVGCGYKKGSKVLNYIPKNRRVTDLF